MPLGGSLRGVLQNAHAFGVRAALRDVEYRALNKLTRVRILHCMTLVTDDVAGASAAPPGFVARVATAGELHAARAEPEWAAEMTTAFIDGACGRGDECVGVFDGRRLVSMAWLARAPTHITRNLVLHFDPAWAYSYKNYTLAAYRGRRLHALGVVFALGRCVRAGARGLVLYVDHDNFASLRAMRRMGFRQLGDVYVVGPEGREVAWSSPGCRSHQVRVERREMLD